MVRDLDRTEAIGFPVFARGTSPVDINGRFEVVGTNQSVVIDGVTISPGDVIIADRDGVVVVPSELEAEVVALVRSKSRGEQDFRAAVSAGRGAADAYRDFGVL